MQVPVLMTWGPLRFEVFPLNIHEYDHATATDWARHEVLGAPVQREHTGTGDDELTLRGRIFPTFFRMNGRKDGLDAIDAIDRFREMGFPWPMIRGDGVTLGWYVLERLSRGHAFLDSEGRGKIVSFEGHFSRFAGKPDAAEFQQQMFGLTTV
jgi:phage protein U